MRILSNYIASTIIKTTLMVFLVFSGLQFFIVFVSQMHDINHGDYGVIRALIYVFLSMPLDVYQIFPMIGLIGSLLGFSLLARQSELTVMRVSGVSLLQLFSASVRGMLLLIVMITAVGEGVAPLAKHYASNLKLMAVSGGQAIASESGLWLKEKDTFIHIHRILPGGLMEGVSLYNFDSDHHLLSASYASEASYQDNHWILSNVKQSFIYPDHVIAKTITQQDLALKVNSSLLKISDNAPEEMMLSDLFRYLKYRYQNKMQGGEYALVFWQRLFRPFATLVMMLLAMPFVLGRLQRSTMGFRLMLGIFVAFAFYLLNNLAGAMSVVYQFPVFLASSLPILFFAVIGFFMLRQVK